MLNFISHFLGIRTVLQSKWQDIRLFPVLYNVLLLLYLKCYLQIIFEEFSSTAALKTPKNLDQTKNKPQKNPKQKHIRGNENRLSQAQNFRIGI